MYELLIYLGAGAISGLLAGLFGVGGGTVIVPILAFAFTAQHFPETHLMHMALGTSLATIMLTSISSARAHHTKSNVNWDIVKRLVPGIVVGTAAGAVLASSLHSAWLQLIFATFLLLIATQLMWNYTPDAHRALPGPWGTSITSIFIGIISSLVGIGGGSLTVPFLIYCNETAKRAVGTSAAIGLPLAIAGTISYILAGIHVENLPAYSIGFIYLPAFAGIAIVSMFTAPIGANIAQKLPSHLLKRLFAMLLYAVSLKMAWGLI